MSTIDFPSQVTDTTPTFLVGGNASTSQPSKAASASVGLAVLAANDQGTAQAAIGVDPAGTAATLAAAAAAAARGTSLQKAQNLSDLASAAAARVNLGVDARITHAFTSFVIPVTAKEVATSGAGAAVAWTLPAASAVNAGYEILIIDEVGGCSGINVLTINRAGSDTINGSTSQTITTAYGALRLISNGSNTWTLAAGTGGGLDATALHAAANLSDVANAASSLANLNVGVTRLVTGGTDALTAADNGKTIVVNFAGTVTFSVPNGLPAGFGVVFDVEQGTLVFAGAATTNDSRAPNMAAPCCQILLQTGSNAYRVFGSSTQVPWATTYDAGATAGPAKTIDFNNGTDQVLSLTQNCTITLSNVPALNRGTLRITQAAGTSFTITWAAAVGSIRGPNGTRPQPTSAVSSATPVTDMFVVNYDATGSKHYDVALAMPNLS